jgi:hypothetical protein
MADSKTTRTRLDGTDADVGKSGMPIQFESLDPWAPMTRPEAVTITNRIKRTADELWSLLSTAHARRAWEPLGYGSWHEFVGTEFSMSRGRSYQLLNQAMVIRQIEVAIAEQRGDSVSTSVDISEAAARDIKPVLGEVVTDIRDRMRSLPEMDPREHVHAAVDVARNKRRSRRPGLVITPRGRRFNVEGP